VDPDGTGEFGLLVAVEAPTGAVYWHQCAGYLCSQRHVEGFAVPLGTRQAAQELIDFFAREFKGWPPPVSRKEPWNEANLAELEAVVTKIPYWHCEPENRREDRSGPLRLDRSRVDEITEAWVPVVTLDGPGILMFENSD
jgi:hypothetical protein